MMIIIGVIIYFAALVFTCVFLKGATQMANEWEERQKIEKFLKSIEEEQND